MGEDDDDGGGVGAIMGEAHASFLPQLYTCHPTFHMSFTQFFFRKKQTDGLFR